MDETEKLVATYLASQGHKKIVYEPDGNVPPDFLVDDRIAVEVRRLNQSYGSGLSVKGLEEVAIPLRKKVNKLALSFGPPVRGVSWFLFLRFGRPIESWKTLRSKLQTVLHEFKAGATHIEKRLSVGAGLKLEIIQASTAHLTFYVLAGYSDRQSGGWVLSEMQRNLAIYITQKSHKIKHLKKKYPEWWLVFVDHIGHGLDDFDVQQFKTECHIAHEWDKVVVIHPDNTSRSFEV
jgi:hypothetical protein